MKISEVIDRIETEFPNMRDSIFTDEWIIHQLSILDSKIKRDVIDTHMGFEEYKDFEPYAIETDREQELLIKPPFDDSFYIDYMLAMCNLELKEYDDYNMRITMFESKEQDFYRAYNRAHRYIVPHPDYRF